MNSNKTNILFENNIVDTQESNILIYESFYNGGGVALGDINNDGLIDIYFSGNQVSDKLYLNKGNFVFEDITEKAGILNKGGWSSGVSFADINQDGFLDIYVCKTLYDESPELRRNELYINNGDGTFIESALKWGVDDVWRSMDATFFDYDLDGDLDMFLVNQPPNPGFFSPLRGKNWLDPLFSCRLFQNQGDFFVDVSEKAGVLQKGYGLSVTASDFNNDGWTDLYVSNDYDTPDFLYKNNGDGTFTNVINKSMRHISYFSMGTDAADINNDGNSDLITLDMVAADNYRLKANMSGMNPKQFWNIVNAGGHYQYMFNALQINNGIGVGDFVSFSDTGQISGISQTDWSWTPLMADFNNDGLKDIFITNGIKRDLRNTDSKQNTEYFLHKKTQDYIKENPSKGEVSIWNVVDFKEIIDFLPSQKLSNYMFVNNGDYTFRQKQRDWGLDDLTFSSGAAYGDLDNDGDLDLVVSNVDDKASIYRNNSNEITNNNYLRIVLKNEVVGKSQFGVKVKIEYGGKTQYGETICSRGFYSTSENIIHFGIGEYKKIDRIVVTWPNGSKTIRKKIKANQKITIAADKTLNVSKNSNNVKKSLIFTNETHSFPLSHRHQENNYSDYKEQVLLPHKMSQFGPAIAVADINNDGLEDVFVGGANGFSAALYVQGVNGNFKKISENLWKNDAVYEDIDAIFVDINNDGFKDLYVVSGGNEFPANDDRYVDRLYMNDGNENFTKEITLDVVSISGSVVVSSDYDNDGDLDLFVGGRHVPHKYPLSESSMLLENKNGILKNVTIENAPDLINLGMVTDAIWTDYDNDNDKDLVIVGEWMPITIFKNDNGNFVKENFLDLNNTEGWWFSIEEGDFDNDGDMDFIVGNLGLNYKYKASKEEPFDVYYEDFDGNGSGDIVLGYYNHGEHYPLRGFSCSSQQIPRLKKDFKKYDVFASLNIEQIYGENKLEKAHYFKANTFATSFVENLGGGKFNVRELPVETQFSSVNDILIEDFNADGNLDVLLVGNLFVSEIETPRNDAGIGCVLLGDGKNNFNYLTNRESGFFAREDAKKVKLLNGINQKLLLVANNNDKLQVFKIKVD